MCLSESCVAGPMGCVDRTFVTIIVYIVSGVLQLLFFVELCFIIYLLVGLKMNGNFQMNAQVRLQRDASSVGQDKRPKGVEVFRLQ